MLKAVVCAVVALAFVVGCGKKKDDAASSSWNSNLPSKISSGAK